ncbi:hypothetical protein [Citrobacter phage Tr1]|nr:hypothetical protein [Citrobacter phage Tr1]
MYNLTWEQALEAMRNGKLVEHNCFCGGEFFEMQNGRVVDEAGYSMAGWNRNEGWQQTDWRILEDS